MKRSLIMVLLLATMIVVAACGGSDLEQSDQAAPTESQRTQAEPAPDIVQQETTQERVPADGEAAESERASTQEGKKSSGLSVTTIGGEEVRLGGQGEVTALLFMAGW